MKLEKREITLNEQDTLLDICRMEESLLHDYVALLAHIQRKQTRELLLTHIREVAEETGISIRIKNIRYAFSNMVELPSRQTLQIIYDAEYVSGDVTLNPSEHTDYCWVPIEEVKNYPLINFVDEMLKNT